VDGLILAVAASENHDGRVRVPRTPPISMETAIFADEFGFVFSLRLRVMDLEVLPEPADQPLAKWVCFCIFDIVGRAQNPELRTFIVPARFSHRSHRENRAGPLPPNNGGSTERRRKKVRQNRKSFIFRYLVASFM
jgi:hypothetical protein